MSNFTKRLILFLIFLPTVLLSFFFPVKNHIIIFILYGAIVTWYGSHEFALLIKHKGITIKPYFLGVCNTLLFICSYLFAHNVGNLQSFRPAPLLFFAALIGLVSYILSRDILKQDLTHSFEKIAYTLTGLIYIGLPSLLVPFIFNLSFTESSTPLFYNIAPHGTWTGSFTLLLLIIIIWSNDIFAYLFGRLLGKNNSIGLTASPNKSWAGYIGGYLSSFVIVTIYIGFIYFIPFLRKHMQYPLAFYYITTLIVGIMVPIGDLVESVIKRSVNIKDSGNLMMGRGGVLDSIDSILFTIPIFFMLVQIYFSFRGL